MAETEIVCERGGAASELQCAGPLYQSRSGVVQCLRHIVTQYIWQHSGAAWQTDLVNWEAQLQPSALDIMDNARYYVDPYLWQPVEDNSDEPVSLQPG